MSSSTELPSSPPDRVPSGRRRWATEIEVPWFLVACVVAFGVTWLSVGVLVKYEVRLPGFVTRLFFGEATWVAAEPTFRNAATEVWRVVLGGQSMIWVGLLWLNWPDVRRSVQFRHGLFPVVLIGALLLSANQVDCLRLTGPNFSVRGTSLAVFVAGYVSLGCGIVAILSALVWVSTLTLTRSRPDFAALIRERDRLRRVLRSLTLALVVAVLCTTWQRHAVERATPGAFPADFVFAYGAYFTVLLSAVIVPAIVAFHHAGVSWLDGTCPMLEFDQAIAERREKASKELGLTAESTIEAVFSALAPVLTALGSIELGK